MAAGGSRPTWNHLFDIADAQEGLFTTQQAAKAGFSPQLLAHHARNGRVLPVRRGIYRLAYYPSGDHDELVIAWLWSDRAGVFSHQTALAQHGLSDALSARIHLTLPGGWRRRRFRVPEGVVLHHADVPDEERAWFGAVPVTAVRRTLDDCAREDLSPDLLRQAAQQAVRRGLVVRSELAQVEEALRPFGGVGG